MARPIWIRRNAGLTLGLTLTGMITAGLIATSSASAHARFNPSKPLKPRNVSSGLKSGPCGGVAASTERTTFAPGQQVTVEWEETINHPGWFRIAFSPSNDLGFDANVLKDDIIDTQTGPVDYNDPGTYHQYSTTITLPQTTCETCTLQLIQYMTENDPPSKYYSCADIRIVEGGGESGDADTSGTDATPDPETDAGSETDTPALKAPDAPLSFTVKVRTPASTGGK